MVSLISLFKAKSALPKAVSICLYVTACTQANYDPTTGDSLPTIQTKLAGRDDHKNAYIVGHFFPLPLPVFWFHN